MAAQSEVPLYLDQSRLEALCQELAADLSPQSTSDGCILVHSQSGETLQGFLYRVHSLLIPHYLAFSVESVEILDSCFYVRMRVKLYNSQQLWIIREGARCSKCGHVSTRLALKLLEQ